MQKANYYDNKFKYGEFETADAVVRKVAVGIVKNQIENQKTGRMKEQYINGKLIKTSFDKMPSPSSFGGGVAVKLEMRGKGKEQKTGQINKEKYEKFDRKRKPFAEFLRPELAYLNNPEVKDYLKRPLRMIKFERKPKELVANTAKVGVFKVKRFEPGEPFSSKDFALQASKARAMQKGAQKSFVLTTHLGAKRTLPISHFSHAKVQESVQEHLADLESKLEEYLQKLESNLQEAK